ncbi:hypothetical protein LZ32DRAFT_598797 [Colletotrichum eremochloae]|nr:hypothetical protein LZ32DRAFT_598797 [Colletotrichum eremochloae]
MPYHPSRGNSTKPEPQTANDEKPRNLSWRIEPFAPDRDPSHLPLVAPPPLGAVCLSFLFGLSNQRLRV